MENPHSPRSPSAVDRQHGARDRSGCVAAQERGQFRHLLDRDELLRRLDRKQPRLE
jgi:hypothetical protein